MTEPTFGSTIGGYRIEARIGRGGMGVVYRATHMALDKQVALKVIAAELAEDEGFRERFRREPRLAASIDHPNVIPVFDAGETDEGLFVAMRYVEGSDLRELIADEGRLDPKRAAWIVAQVADALDAAHELGLIHRDVKPANVLIEDRRGREHVYLTDFGLTKGGEGATALTRTGQWVGTPDYVAPEQIHGGMLDRRTDIYALGGVLYHSLSGHAPYGRETEVAKIYAHLSKPPPELPAEVNASPELKATIRRGMAKEPAERYSSAGELGRDALAATGEEGAQPSNQVVAPTVPAEPPGETVAADEVTAPDATAIAAAATAPGATAAAPGDTPATAAAPGDTPVTAAGAASGQTVPAAGETAVPPTPAPGGIGRLLGDRRAFGVTAVLAIVAFAAAGFAIGSSNGDGDGDTASFSNSASTGTFVLRHPDGWNTASEGTVKHPRIKFSDEVTLTPRGSDDGAGLVAGQVDADGPRLLPDGFVDLLGKKPSGEPVKFDGLEALRYSNLRPNGYRGSMTLFTVPTTNGVATIVCAAPAGTSGSVTEQCQQIATTLDLVNTEPFPLGPDEKYAKALDDAIGPLDEARKEQRKQARDAKKPGEQAAAFERLAASYGQATDPLGLRVSPAAKPANDAILAALRAGKDAHLRMARAARDNDNGGYVAAREDADRADQRLEEALKRLRPLGYEARSG